ncbi:MAG: hypothetical protein Q4D30_12350 [Bacteroidales bacterium]|nr:hypothetical protein [Bacteroidales bacterium]
MKKIIFNSIQREVTLDGLMTLGTTENGLRTADFECCEDVEMEAFVAHFKVQGMRDGNIYMTELPKRIRNKAIFRDDNATLSHGQDGKYYFYFSIAEERIEDLPQELVRQAGVIAQKVLRELVSNL